MWPAIFCICRSQDVSSFELTNLTTLTEDEQETVPKTLMPTCSTPRRRLSLTLSPIAEVLPDTPSLPVDVTSVVNHNYRSSSVEQVDRPMHSPASSSSSSSPSHQQVSEAVIIIYGPSEIDLDATTESCYDMYGGSTVLYSVGGTSN